MREAFLRAFMYEGKLLHRLSRSDAGVVQALDIGAAVAPSGAWTPYLALEWLEGSSLEEWGQEVTANTASFITEDHAFPMESFRPVLISHDLHWLNSQLVGTGSARGDGDDLGCAWTVELAGIVDFSP